MQDQHASPQAAKARQQRQKLQQHSRLEKKQKNLYLSLQARHLLSALSLHMGISETAVVELLVREKAARENIILPAHLRPTPTMPITPTLTVQDIPHD
jgi:hypothetical protein